MYSKEWFPNCYVMGITWQSFWDMTPFMVMCHRDGYQLKTNEQNALFHLEGIYTRDALMATVGNMFIKKGAKPYEYPQEPYQLNKNDGYDGDKELTEEEKIRETDKLFATLKLLQANFNLSHGNNDGDSE